jgi:hypothetical protein
LHAIGLYWLGNSRINKSIKKRREIELTRIHAGSVKVFGLDGSSVIRWAVIFFQQT